MKTKRHLQYLPGIFVTVLLLVSCSEATPQAPTDEPPTATPFPTFAFVEPTTVAAFEQAETETPASEESDAGEAVSLDPKKVERGLGRYQALECGSCHGENGEGSDKAGSLLDFALVEDDFITFVRSGGDLGPSHQYSTDRLSNSGSRNLYEYMLSLARSD